MTRIFFGEKLNTQTTGSHIYEAVKQAADMTGILVASNNPITKWLATRKVKRILARVDKDIEIIVRARYSVLQKQKVLPTRTTATSLLDRMLLAQAQSGQPIDHRLMTLILENSKGFLAAGYGTTADTSSVGIHLAPARTLSLANWRSTCSCSWLRFPMFSESCERNTTEYLTRTFREPKRCFTITQH